MVLNFRGYPHIVKAYVKLNQQHERRIYFNYNKKYLSIKVPFQKKERYLKQKLEELLDWYDHFTGMDEVRAAQKRVLEDEERFRESQENRRRVLSELSAVQSKLKNILTDIENTARGDERYISLVTQEHKLIKEEKDFLEKFKNAEKLERESFAALSSSVKVSHEKERAQSERTKYWSIIGSILGTVIGILGSSINNHFRMSELKQLIINSTNARVMDSVTSYLEENGKILEKLGCTNFDWSEERQCLYRIENLMESLTMRLTDVETSLKNLSKSQEKYVSELPLGKENNVIVTVPISSVEDSIKKEYHQTKVLLFTIAVLSIVMPIINRCS